MGRRIGASRPLYAIMPSMFPPLRHISPRLSGRMGAARNFLTTHSGLLVCALFLLAGLDLAGDYGLGLDAWEQRRTAAGNLDYILGRADRVEYFKYHDWLYGVAFELPLLLAERALGLEDYHYVHRLRLTLTHLFFIVGAFFCYRLACRLFNNRLLALFALLIFLLHPRLYAHSFVNSKDLPFLTMFVLALYLLERAFRRDTWGAFVLLGIAVGLLTNLRIMGAMLLPAVLAMRGLDLFYTGKGPERKHILRTAGLFVLTAGLTLYTVTPYAWSDPVDYLAAGLDLTINHPTVAWQLFQGAWFLSTEQPPQYNAVWFGITTPPLFLLLGVIGIAAVLAQGLRRPGSVFRNTRRRFLGLLLAGFLLPPLAVALLGANQYDTWRHLHFVYVPFGLLAAGGLGGLAAALSRRPPRAAGVYGLAGLGLGLVLLQMTQLHPLQYSYFNFLVDRTTPEYLQTQYPFGYQQLRRYAALRHLLASHPGETLVVRDERDKEEWTDWEILPPADRERLLLPTAGRRADYELVYPTDPGQPDLFFSSAYRRLYNNTITALRPLDASRMTAAAIAAYQELYRQATAREPIIRADYDVYLDDRRLTFVRENCPPEEPDAWFGARIFLRHRESLPPPLQNKPRPYTALRTHGVRLGRLCLAVLQLPDYARDSDLILRRGHWGDGGRAGFPLWEELYPLSRRGLREVIADHRRNQSLPAGPDAFEVFLDRESGRHRLLYAKRNCSPAEYETRVTLHIYPANLADLPAELRGDGFDNRDFPLTGYGGRPGGECLAVYPLPDYPIAAIFTGQAGIWAKNLYPPADLEPLRAAYAAVSAIQPAARSAFDLYVQGNRLIYLRESCTAADMAEPFFLHIFPAAADLPAGLAANQDNRDFDFGRWGGRFDGKCLATVPLPEYPVKAIRTGQHIPGQGALWSVELIAAPDYNQLRADYAALAGAEPAARDYFNLYLRDSRLLYLRETCAVEDMAANFFLHIVPEDVADLPADRRDAGFAHGGFVFVRQGGRFDGKCLAAVPLPDYPIKEMRTGQHIPGQGNLWSVQLIAAPDYAQLRATYAALSAVEPAARDYFDLYRRDNRLIYLRETCAEGDTAANFFLHIVPENPTDLPEDRQAAGFAHGGFAFVRQGGRFDGKCLASVALPDYPIKEMRTGQYVPGQGDLWSAAIAAP